MATYLWLKHITDGTATARRLRVVSYDPNELPTTERIEGTTLRSIRYSHTLAVRRRHEITIGARELADSDSFGFIKAFWAANQWYVCYDDSLTEPDAADFVQIIVAAGDIPVEYLRDNRYLPGMAFTAVDKHPT